MAEYDIQGNPNVDKDYLRQEQDADNAITCPSCGCTQAYYWPWRDAGYCPACGNIFNPYEEGSMGEQEPTMFNPGNYPIDHYDDNLKISIVNYLRDIFPYGHKKFTELSIEEMALHSKKNYDYAHGGDPLGNFVRVANILSNYPGLKLTPPVVALVYAMKQLDAVLWQLSQGYEGTVEGIDDKAQDIHVYVKLFRILLEEA